MKYLASMTLEYYHEYYLSAGVHRVLITTVDNKVKHIISQSDVARFIHKGGLGPYLSSPVTPSVCKARLEAVSSKATVLDVILRLGQHGTHAVPLIDDSTGKLLATFSTSGTYITFKYSQLVLLGKYHLDLYDHMQRYADWTGANRHSWAVQR